MARWHRAAAWLGVSPGSRVLDLGCAFGFGTRLLVDRFKVYGHDLSRGYIERARRAVPEATFTCGPASAVPYPDGYFDAVLLLDVLEHVPDQQAVLREVSRVLRTGGELIVSVPNVGALAGLDSLNLYVKLFGPRAPAPTDDPSWTASPYHRHYRLEDLSALLGPAYELAGVRYSGIGLAEAINLLLLTALRRVRLLTSLYARAQYLYFGAYLLEDTVSLGRRSYHLMARYRHVPSVMG